MVPQRGTKRGREGQEDSGRIRQAGKDQRWRRGKSKRRGEGTGKGGDERGEGGNDPQEGKWRVQAGWEQENRS